MNVLLDLSSVTAMSSVGLGALITNHVTLSCNEGALKLVNVPQIVQRLFETTFLSYVFSAYNTESEAFDSFW